MKLRLYRILKWISIHIFETILGTLFLSWIGLAVVDLTKAKFQIFALIEIAKQPTPLWATIGLVAAAYLMLKTTLSRSYTNPNQVKPNLSKKTEIQEKILISLKDTEELSNIVSVLKSHEQLIIHNLETLESDSLVSRPKIQMTGNSIWFLTKYGRDYLAKNKLLE
jgi:hypothetical protein